MDTVRLTGKTVIVTGGTSGIGIETVRELASRGARVIVACRNAEKGQKVREDILTSHPSSDVIIKSLDLASLQSVKAFADDFNATESRLDILVNNAGVLVSERHLTEDNFEMHFGVNHLGHFYLTFLLLDKLKSSAPSRVVVVASKAHELSQLDFKDLQIEHGWGSLKAYGRSKTANILFAVHLAKILQGSGVTVYSLHPGVIDTDLAREFTDTWYVKMFNCCYKCCCGGLLTPEEGARTTLYCCLEPKLADQSGLYYSDSKKASARSYATSEKNAELLWRESLKLCNIEHL